MSHYIGIDLGTTNSAICSYDGQYVRIWKSPEQNDVTPSAIYVGKRGNRYYGAKAYNQAPYNPQNAATLFKRFLGTNHTIALEDAGLTLTPEQCSAEILKLLLGYLPEEIRNDPETAVVITVPAAFNQMKKTATLQAAEMAGIHRVALMQEPVAAVMSVMCNNKQDGVFLVYDLGGGTFDVSVAENIGGRVNLLAHGGVEMCGGRDIDRAIFAQVVIPWLHKNFNLPQNFERMDQYKTFCRIVQWATERAKIELSATDCSIISLSEMETRTVDEDGTELYLDMELTREMVNGIIAPIAEETIRAVGQTLDRAGLSAQEVQRIVFVGGPTNYKPLRDMVCQKLGLPGNIDVNPMTAVAEGASIFAESIDWSSASHNRKSGNSALCTEQALQLKYMARTAADRAKVACILEQPLAGHTVCITSLDTGWSSGQLPLVHQQLLELPLTKQGENRFSVEVRDEHGNLCPIGTDRITIVKTLATIQAIPASHAIGIEVMEKLGGEKVLQFLVREGDPLPKKCTVTVKAGQAVRAGSADSLNIKLWEGNIEHPVEDNRFIGVLKIAGKDVDFGLIPIGADIVCDFEMSDSGTISLEASVPCIGASFKNKNFYSSAEGQVDLNNVQAMAEEGRTLLQRVTEISSRVTDARLNEIKTLAQGVSELDSCGNQDPEAVQKANNNLLEIKKQLNEITQDHQRSIRQMDLNKVILNFKIALQGKVSESQQAEFDQMVKIAQGYIDRDERDFDEILTNLKRFMVNILFTQDWFIMSKYIEFTQSSVGYRSQEQFEKLKARGNQCLADKNFGQLRQVLLELVALKANNTGSVTQLPDIANIIKG